ncbi:alpha/beta fold hydrolase [Amycolatopsis sp. NPDC023774]|uniref:alpha/beta hydrolase family protein n=1 Tax=Amycolatopsis sp. NPDC023774 TaxID=3155015 RepID=UPI0033F6468E
MTSGCSTKAHPTSARDAYLRASTYYRSAEFFLHGNSADPRIADAYDRSIECFHRAIEGFAGVERVELPYEGHVLRGYFYRASGTARRPNLLAHNGFDGSAEQVHFFGAAGGQERGYHVLAFDGRRQPSAIHRDGLVFRPAWEHVVGPVLDFVLADAGVDPDKVALLGLSLGGMLAPRGAAFDERIKAVVAVAGVFDVGSAVTAFQPWDRTAIERRANAPQDEELDKPLAAGRWATDHGRYVMGAATDREFLAKYLPYTLDGGVAERIKCPTLVCEAADDLFFNGDGETQPEARRVNERLTGPKTLLSFTYEEGADAHCHVGAQRLATAPVFDWLDETL